MTEYFKKDGEDFVKVEDELLTSEQVNSIVKERGERIARQKYSDYDDLKEKAASVDKLKDEYENKLKEKDTTVSDLNKQLGVAKLETDRVKIVHEFKLSDELAEFVTGDTAEDMRKRAEKLANGVKTGNIKIDKKGKPDTQDTESKKLVKGLFGKKSDD
jgi:hypothetical protein